MVTYTQDELHVLKVFFDCGANDALFDRFSDLFLYGMKYTAYRWHIDVNQFQAQRNPPYTSTEVMMQKSSAMFTYLYIHYYMQYAVQYPDLNRENFDGWVKSVIPPVLLDLWQKDFGPIFAHMDVSENAPCTLARACDTVWMDSATGVVPLGVDFNFRPRRIKTDPRNQVQTVELLGWEDELNTTFLQPFTGEVPKDAITDDEKKAEAQCESEKCPQLEEAEEREKQWRQQQQQ